MIFGADPNSVFPWAAGGTGFTLLTVALFLLGRQITNLLRENRACNRRLGILYRVIVTNALMIPPEFFDEVTKAASSPIPDAEKGKSGN